MGQQLTSPATNNNSTPAAPAQQNHPTRPTTLFSLLTPTTFNVSTAVTTDSINSCTNSYKYRSKNDNTTQHRSSSTKRRPTPPKRYNVHSKNPAKSPSIFRPFNPLKPTMAGKQSPNDDTKEIALNFVINSRYRGDSFMILNSNSIHMGPILFAFFFSGVVSYRVRVI
ncbi:hypothetical protein FXO37_16131 [Capsicum annuum]|nr:hypothetical protein FXO37_16131 [Capsicum annuum]